MKENENTTKEEIKKKKIIKKIKKNKLHSNATQMSS